MALACARRLLPTIIAQIVQQLGWDAIHQSVMDVLVDILDRNLTNVCRKVHMFAELDGRTVPDLDDLGMAFRDLGVNLHDLIDYVTEVEPLSLAVDVPQFPVSAEKMRSLLNTEKKSVVNSIDVTGQNEEHQTETEDGTRAAGSVGAGTVTTPGTSTADKKPFSNETGANKRLRSLPDEAMHSQYEMKSFLVSDSGSFIPIRPGIRASTRCASPDTPRRPRQPSPTLPMYVNEKANVISEAEVKRTFEPEVAMFHTKHVKKSSKLPKDGLHKLLKHGVSKPKKLPHVGSLSLSKLQKPKPLKAEKTLLNKSKASTKKSSSEHSTPRTIDKMMKKMFPDDLVQAGDETPLEKELQKSRIRSYEDSINTVVQYSSQDGIKFSPDEFNDADLLLSVVRHSTADDKVSPVDNFYLDLGAPSPPPPSQLFDHAAERDAHINSAIDDVIKASSADDDLRLSPEPGESDIEMEPKQSAVEDIFDVSSVPSPKITAWPVIEEEVIEEPVAADVDNFTVLNTPSDRSTPVKKSKKLPKTADKVSHDFDAAVKKSEERIKKPKHRSVEPPVFDVSSLDSWSEDDWERTSKTPLERLAVLSETSFPRSVDSWNKKSKHQTSEQSNIDFVSARGRDREDYDKTFKLFPDPDVFQPRVGADEPHKKQKHRRTNDDSATPYGEEKNAKPRSNRLAFAATPEPPRDARDRLDDIFTGSQDSRQSLVCEWPKVRLESFGFDDEKKTSRKRQYPCSPTPPHLRQSPLPYSSSSSTLLPPAPPPSLPPQPASGHLDASSLPPLKRIKIVSSAGVVNQFEIKERPVSSSAVEKDYKRDKKEKKKAKKSRDHERSHDHKDRNRTHELSDHEQVNYSRDRENKDTNKTDGFFNLDASSSFFEDKGRRKFDTIVQNTVFDDRDKKPGKVSGNKHHQKMVLQSSGEGSSKKGHENQLNLGRSSTNLSQDYRFLESGETKVEHRWKGEDWLKEKARSFREEDSDRERSRSHKKKDKSKSRDEGKASKKEDKHKERAEKSLEKSEHKKKKSEKKHESELMIEPTPVHLPTIPKLTLKFGNTSTATPSLSRTSEPGGSQPVLRTTETPTNPPIKLRFKTGFSCLPNAASSPSLAGQSLYGDSSAAVPPTKVAVQQRLGQSVLEMPTFSPSPESISIPSPNDSSDSELSVSGRARTPTPPSLSIPAPIVPRPRVPYYTSSSSSSSHSLSPPLLHLPKEVDGHQTSFSISSRKSAPPQPVIPISDSRILQTPKMDSGSKSLKTPSYSKGSSQKPKSNAKAASPPKVSLHAKGIPPSKIMPPSTPMQSLLPAAKSSLSSAKSGSTKSKKRVTTETVSKVVNEDGVITWICPACLVEDKGEEPMIGCDECDDWYHWRCVGVLVEPPEEIPWYCRRCQVKSKVMLKTPSTGRGKGKKSKKK